MPNLQDAHTVGGHSAPTGRPPRWALRVQAAAAGMPAACGRAPEPPFPQSNLAWGRVRAPASSMSVAAALGPQAAGGGHPEQATRPFLIGPAWGHMAAPRAGGHSVGPSSRRAAERRTERRPPFAFPPAPECLPPLRRRGSAVARRPSRPLRSPLPPPPPPALSAIVDPMSTESDTPH